MGAAWSPRGDLFTEVWGHTTAFPLKDMARDAASQLMGLDLLSW